MHLRRVCVLLLVECPVDVREVKVPFSSPIPLLIVCVIVVFTIQSEVLKSPAIVVELSIFLFNSVSLCFINFGALLLGACMFTVVMSSCWTDLFTITACSPLCLDKALFESFFERRCHWKFYSNAQVLLTVSSTNNLLYCFLN